MEQKILKFMHEVVDAKSKQLVVDEWNEALLTDITNSVVVDVVVQAVAHDVATECLHEEAEKQKRHRRQRERQIVEESSQDLILRSLLGKLMQTMVRSSVCPFRQVQ